jgi:hypothetical protein
MVMSREKLVLENRNVKRTAAHLGATLDKNLMSYAMAAGAAGVGLLALAQPAEAKIVYTPAHKNIGAKTFIDLNHDGINDFKVTLVRTSHCEGGCTTSGARHGTAFQVTYARLSVFGAAKDNQVYGQGKLASALPAGVRVGPKGKFPGGNVMATINAISGNTEGHSGAWAGAGTGVQRRFLGLKFKIHGETHFGWARFNVTLSQKATIHATLTGYAYETVANKAIVTGRTKGPEGDESTTSASVGVPPPVPASLALLAQGSAGLVAWRRRDDIA